MDPPRPEALETHATRWGQVIPYCGADLIGAFAPPEGPATMAHRPFRRLASAP